MEEAMKKGKMSIRPVFDMRRKIAATLVGLICLAVGVFLLFRAMRRESTVREQALYSYELSANAEPWVHLRENSVFSEEWLSAGAVYPGNLADLLWVKFSAKLTGEGSLAVRLSGQYEAAVELAGYFNRDGEKKQIFSQRISLESGEMQAGEEGGAFAETTAQLNPADYAERFAAIERELGGSFEHELKLVFSGKFVLESEAEQQEKPFSLEIPLPDDTKSGFYTLETGAETKDSGSITRRERIALSPSFPKLALSVLLLVSGVFLVLTGLVFSKAPTAEEARKIELRRLLRKYGARLVFTESPEAVPEDAIRLKNLESLLLVAEELRQPAVCSQDAEGLPLDGMFTVRCDNRSFFVQIPESLPLSE